MNEEPEKNEEEIKEELHKDDGKNKKNKGKKILILIICIIVILSVIDIIINSNTKYIKTSLEHDDSYSVILENYNYEIIKNYKRYCEVIRFNKKYGPTIFLTNNLLVIKYEGNTNLYTSLKTVSYNNNKLNVVLEGDTSGWTAGYLTDLYTIPIKKSIKQSDINMQINNINYYKHSEDYFITDDGIPFPMGDIAKPIIYLYPQQETTLTVKLGNPEKLTCSYPKYKKTGWNVTAYPDGTLVDNETGRSLYSLYWEGINTENTTFNDGFCIKGEDTIKFLEEKLELLGLNEREAEEFIVYWLPKLEDNEYNLIRFESKEKIDKEMPLEFSVKPDTVIRVLMEFKAVENFVEIPEQKIETPKREGFVAVEWGGTEI